MNRLNLSNYTLLIVDDDDTLRRLLADFFRIFGATVITAAHGREALDLLRNNHVDVVISDYIMPAMNGEQFFDIVQRSNVKLKAFYFMTGNCNLILESSLLKTAELTGTFLKPFNLENIKQTIGAILKAA